MVILRVFINVMQVLSSIQFHRTSISLSRKSIRRLRATQLILTRNEIFIAEQQLYAQFFRLYLKRWRGHGKKSATLRRYNRDGRKYAIRPLYINQILYATLWQRAIHSGVSVSRILNFAIYYFSRRLLEDMISTKRANGKNFDYWKALNRLRKPVTSEYFINYECKTIQNGKTGLKYLQNTIFRPSRAQPRPVI